MFERDVVALCSKFGDEYATPQDVCVGEGGIAFSAYERGPLFATVSIYVDPPPTSSASHLVRYGVLEREWMSWSAPRSLAC